MSLRAIVAACAVLSVSTIAFAEVITVNSSKSLSLYDGGSDSFFIDAGWSYTGGTAETNKANSFKTWMTFSNATVRPYVSAAELTLTQWYNGNIAIATPVTIDLYALTDSTGDSWNTGSVTWATAPANVASSSKDLDGAKTVLAGSYTFTGQFPAKDEVIHIPFNAAGVSFINGDIDGLSTFILAARDDSAVTSSFFGYTNSATLLAAVPEPVSLGGLLSASFGLLVRKRQPKRIPAA